MLKIAHSKKNILLVDDDRGTTETLSILFEMRGYNVITAKTGREALQKANQSIDLILLDIILPDEGGFEICEKLRRNKETSNAAIIILTGKLLTNDKIEGLHIGADDYLTKPFEYEELIARMEAVMRRRPVFANGRSVPEDEEHIVLELRKIIDTELITPYFQPIFQFEPFSLFGYETLCHPHTKSGLSAPDVLFRAAFQYGFYQDLELLGWRKALVMANRYLMGKKLFLNCNPYLVEIKNTDRIKSIFQNSNISTNDIYLEITERSAVQDFEQFYVDLQKFREMGFKFAVDDLGRGYACLETVVVTRPEVVKIDRLIVTALKHDALRRSVVKSIVSLCHRHNIFAIAEGIETKEDFMAVKDLGVDAGQGYYFAKPSPEMHPHTDIIEKFQHF